MEGGIARWNSLGLRHHSRTTRVSGPAWLALGRRYEGESEPGGFRGDGDPIQRYVYIRSNTVRGRERQEGGERSARSTGGGVCTVYSG